MIQVLTESRRSFANLYDLIRGGAAQQEEVDRLVTALGDRSVEVYQAQALVDLEGPMEASALTERLSTAHDDNTTALLDWCHAKIHNGDVEAAEQRLDNAGLVMGETLGEFIAEAHFWLNVLPEPNSIGVPPTPLPVPLNES
ncbi:hypothetical protein AB0D78_09910 [Streptomyces avermitilis]|uniref:hypothetical protein n=1 Tax=Streptomyces avermitilis TaxID=33903 RepID=UPI0034074188